MEHLDVGSESTGDDGEVLRAVLAFLEEDAENDEPYDTRLVGGSASGSPNGSDAESPTSVTGASIKGRARATPRVFNRSRLQRRHEVLSLREQVVALEERLEQLQKGDDGSKADDSDDSGKKLRVAAWQAVVENQRDQLAAAEQEREKLRGLLKEYKNSVKRVERFLKKQTFPQALLEEDLTMAASATLDPELGDGFEEISRNLPAMYMQINGVFSDVRFREAIHGVRDIRVQNAETEHMSIELLESRLMPFSIETTAKAVWHFHQVKAKEVATTIEENVEESENYMRRRFIAMLTLPNHKGKARGRMETRRFVEHGRVVILQYAVFDQTEKIHGAVPDGYGMRQFHWTVIGPPRNERLAQSGRVVCQVETFEVTLPYIENPDPDRDVKKDQEALKQFVFESTKVIQEIERQAIENILMNFSLNAL